MHYNASYGCGKCLKQAFISSLALHNHKKVCLGLASKKSAGVSDGKPSSGRGDSGHGVLPRPPQKGWQGCRCQFPGLECPFCLSAITTPQRMGDLPLPQVPQEGLGQKVKEGKRCKPGLEKHQTPSVQGRWLLLARNPTDISRPALLFNKRLCCTAHMSVITW